MRCGKFPIALLVVAQVAQSAAAYEYPLSSSAVREAYFLGSRKDEKTTEFLAQYVRRFPLPALGPHVAEIEVRTPLQQVVKRAKDALPGYSAFQAQKEYQANPDRIVVRVRVYLTPTYGGYNRPKDFWRDFKISVAHHDAIEPKKVTGDPQYSIGIGDLIGAEVLLEFDTGQIASELLRIEVRTPDGQVVTTEFDLRKLR